MILTPHLLIGAIIGKKFSSPVEIVGLGILSHLALDALPHFEYEVDGLKNKNKIGVNFFTDLAKLSSDFLIGLFLIYITIPAALVSGKILLGAFSATIPDFLLFLHWKFPRQRFLKIFARFHTAFHFWKKTTRPKWLGAAVEIAAVLVFSIILVNLA